MNALPAAPLLMRRYFLARALLLLCVPLLVWQALPGGQIAMSQAVFLSSHSLLEMVSIGVSGLVFFIAFGTREAECSRRVVVLGCFFLATALFDAVHTLSYPGMPDIVSANSPDKMIWFWLAGRFSVGLGLLWYVLSDPDRQAHHHERWALLGWTLVAVAAVCYVVFAHEPRLPAMFVPGQGLTGLKVAVEWLLCGLYLWVAVLFWRGRRSASVEYDALTLFHAMLLMAAGELFFTVYTQVSSTANLLGHVYKVIAYAYLFQAIFTEAVRAPFVRIQQLNAELQREHDFVTGLIDIAPVVIIVVDAQGVLRLANSYLSELSGHAPQDLVEKDWIETLIPTRLHQEVRAAYFKTLQVGVRRKATYPLRNRAGQERLIEWSNQLMRDASGQVTGLLGVGQDVTERHQAMEALQNSERVLKQLNETLESRVQERAADALRAQAEAERSNAAKSEFLSRMSHELRTPLNAIIGFGQLMSSAPGVQRDPDQRENVQEILQAGDHLLTLVNEVLDLSSIESGKLELRTGPVELEQAIRQAAAQLRPLTEQRGIVLELDLSPGDTVLADPTRLQQVLLNLLSNAIKYNRDGGHIWVSTQAGEGSRVRVGVRDTGRGIPEQALDRLFRPFERLESSYEGIEGTGIGLALTRRLVEAMEGRIGVESTPGEGSTFWFDLPLAERPLQAPSPGSGVARTPAVVPVSLRKVLCVEDNPANLRLLKRLLGLRPGIEMLAAQDAEAGLLLAQQETPHAILLDINLPGMDGFEALKRLRDDPRTRHIPVIAVTANAMPRDVKRGKEAGFADYLTKPLDVVRFLDVLDSTLKTHMEKTR